MARRLWTPVLKNRFKTLDLNFPFPFQKESTLLPFTDCLRGLFLSMSVARIHVSGWEERQARKNTRQRQPGTYQYPLTPSSCPEQGCDGYGGGSRFVTLRQPWGWKPKLRMVQQSDWRSLYTAPTLSPLDVSFLTSKENKPLLVQVIIFPILFVIKYIS